MRKPFLLFSLFLLFSASAIAQGSISTYNNLYDEFFDAIRQFKPVENREDPQKQKNNLAHIEEILHRMKIYTCEVRFYPQMVSASIDADDRARAIYYLKECFRYGAHVNNYLLDVGENSPVKYLSKLTIDSLWQEVGRERCPAFNWQKQMEVEDIVDARQRNIGVAWEDSNANRLAQPLRTLIYSYLRYNDFPVDCETGIGSNAECSMLIAQYSKFLHDFEFQELHNLMLQAMRTFALPRSFVVSVVDRYYAQNGESFYGTDVSYFGEMPKMFVNENRTEINANRLRIGMDPI